MIERHAKLLDNRARLVTLDLDPTDNTTHGGQQMSFFNGHYDSWCYLPVIGFVSFNDEAEQYLCAAVLRPGNVAAPVGAMGILQRLLVRHFFPGARIRVRLDGGFEHPELLDFLDAEPNLEHVVAMASNAVLQPEVDAAMPVAPVLAEVTGKTELVYSETNYSAKTWPRQRRMIFKEEVVGADDKEPKDNPRFVITSMQQSPQWIDEEVNCQRGKIENRIKELHALEIDRTSCSSFWANQFRVLQTAVAHVLKQDLRLCASGSRCAPAPTSGRCANGC